VAKSDVLFTHLRNTEMPYTPAVLTAMKLKTLMDFSKATFMNQLLLSE
jgi:hypothetical protein